jgi:integrase
MSGPATPLDLVLRFAEDLFRTRWPSNTFFDMNIENKEKTALTWADEGLYLRNNRYFARVRVDSPTFSMGEIKDVPKFVDRLRRQADPISAFLWQRLSAANQAMLANYQPSAPSSNQVQDAGIRVLNKTIKERCIYERDRFQAILLRPETIDLVKQGPKGSNRARLNRLLLEDAYPLELSRKLKAKGKLTWRSTKTDKLAQARKWKEKWEHKQWLEENGFWPKEPAAPGSKPAAEPPSGGNGGASKDSSDSETNKVPVDSLVDQYVEAGHPIIKKRALKRKSPRSVSNETYCLNPLRAFFGAKDGALLSLADCDQYHAWRNSGGYVAQFKLRGKHVTRKTRGGDRAVDLELIVLRNVLELAVRRGQLKTNPLRDRGQYTDESTVRHCREVAPTPAGLVLITDWLANSGHGQDADLTQFLAYTGLRLGEGLKMPWHAMDWDEELIHVHRSKKGVFPFVLLLPELARLLRRMKRKAAGKFLFPSPFNAEKARDDSAYRRRLKQACTELKLPHVTPQGLRSYFVTQARQSGLTDAEIAQLIGDKTGPSLIAEVYGDVRPDHLLAVARNIQLTAKTRSLARQKIKKGRQD